MLKRFVGYADIRDLKKVKRVGKYGFAIPNRVLQIHDKHWSDGKMALVKITILDAKNLK